METDTANGNALRLLRLTLRDAWLLPTSAEPKFRDAAESVTATPLPVKLIICGLAGSLSLRISLPARVTRPDAVKVMRLSTKANEIKQLPRPLGKYSLQAAFQ